jgi:hypothetical protein
MWPSLETSSKLYNYANFALIAALMLGASSTVIVVWMGNVKESYLKLELSQASTTAETAKENVAEANQKTAELKVEVAQLEKENLNLQKIVQPRNLGPLNIITGSILNKFSGKVIRVSSYSGDLESAVLATQIITRLSGLGFQVQDNRMQHSAIGSIVFGIMINGSNQQLVQTLIDTFKSEGLTNVVQASPPDSPIKMGPSFSMSDAAIFVGVKPLPQN